MPARPRHKDELFEWVRSKLGLLPQSHQLGEGNVDVPACRQELRVVLIANRSDSKALRCDGETGSDSLLASSCQDRERLQQLQPASASTQASEHEGHLRHCCGCSWSSYRRV